MSRLCFNRLLAKSPFATTYDRSTTVALLPKHDSFNSLRKLNNEEGKKKSFGVGQASINGGGHVLQASQGEGGGQAEVEGTGATMQRAVDIPGLNALSLAEFARCREAAMFALESEGSQARQPV